MDITKNTKESIANLRRRPDIERWAAWLFEPEQFSTTAILDSETTGLGADSEIIDLAVLSLDGDVRFDSLIRPKEAVISEKARRIHKITEAALDEAHAPTFAEVWPMIAAVLAPFRRIIVYNAKFDAERLIDTASINDIKIHCHIGKAAAKLPPFPPDVHVIPGLWYDLMGMYAMYHGDIHPYYGTPRWQRLEAACSQMGVEHSNWHRARGDGEATLKLLRAMAAKAAPPMDI